MIIVYENSLKTTTYIYYDINGLDLFSELKFLKEILQIKEYSNLHTKLYKKG